MTGRHTDKWDYQVVILITKVTLRFDVSGCKALGHPLGTDGTGVEQQRRPGDEIGTEDEESMQRSGQASNTTPITDNALRSGFPSSITIEVK